MGKAVVYARVSTEEQAESGYSIPEQLRDLQRYADTHGYSIVAEEVDDGYTSRALSRPALNRVRDQVEAGDVDAVLVHKWNRLSRKAVHQDLFIQEMNYRGPM